MTRVKININPDLLKWARDRARYSEASLAKKVSVSLNTYEQWESGDSFPTLRQLWNLVRALNEPLQTFFMSEVPDEPEPLAALRRIPGAPTGDESPDLAKQVKLTVERRDIALRLYLSLSEHPPSFDYSAKITSNPELVGEAIRELLSISPEEQMSWRDTYRALREWRATLEKIGVLSFQIPYVSMNEMRGFSLSLKPLPIIAFNSHDEPAGRIFTIFHELSHVISGESFLDPGEQPLVHLEAHSEVEQFCNKVAACILVPADSLYSQSRALSKGKESQWDDREVSLLSTRYCVSRAVMVRRLRELGLISRKSFNDLRQVYDNYIPAGSGEEGGNAYSNVLAWQGTLIPHLAFRAYYLNRLTVSELSSLLHLKVKKLGNLEERVFGFNFAFGGS